MIETTTSIVQMLITEVKHEAEHTKKILRLVPDDKLTWKPHEKSTALQNLAQHIAELPGWIEMTINKDQLDFDTDYVPTKKYTSNQELLEILDIHVNKALEALKNATEEILHKPWTLRKGEQVFFTMPKYQIIRYMACNHLIHHRAQLGVYLRLLNIPLPGIYGPTADESRMM